MTKSEEKLKSHPSFFIVIFVLSCFCLVSTPQISYAHTFSTDESSDFSFVIQHISVEIHLAQDNLNDKEIALQHVQSAISLLNATDINEIAERNERIANDLPLALTELTKMIDSNASPDEIASKIKSLDSLLDEAEFSRLGSQQFKDPTRMAQTFAMLVNDALEHYYKGVERPNIPVNSNNSSKTLEQIINDSDYKVQVSWSPMEITAGQPNIYTIKFFDTSSGNLMNVTRYDFMFMPSDDPETMIIHRSWQKAFDGQAEQTFAFKEKRIGSNILRISDINNSGKFVDFSISVLSSNNLTNKQEATSAKIISIVDYQSAQGLTNRLIDLFDTLRKSAPEGTEESILALDSGLMQLKTAVDSKGTVDDVETIVHGYIHPNLMTIFDLKIIPEFGTISAMILIVGIIITVILTSNGKKLTILPRM